MSHNKTKVNSVEPDGSGNISITTDNVAETATNEYYTPARIDTKIAATNIDAFQDVNTAGAVAGNALVLSGGVWTPAGVSAAVSWGHVYCHTAWCCAFCHSAAGCGGCATGARKKNFIT